MKAFIYQQVNWPNFTWKNDEIVSLLSEARNLQGRLMGKMESLGFDLRNEALLETLTLDVVKSSEIEGEYLNPDQVRSSIARRLGMEIAGSVESDRNVDGVVEMMLDATQNCFNPLTAERLFDWHAALFPTGRSGMYKITVAGWRKDTTGPMQVVSGAMGKEKVHFQAPDSSLVEKEMMLFLNWFNKTSKIDLVLKAAVAHLWFVTIHPFEDGNGRIARAMTDMLLAQSDRSNQRFYSMSAQIRTERKAYYEILEKTQKGNLDITAWMIWFLRCLINALQSTDAVLGRVLFKADFWLRHSKTPINERQNKLLNKLLDGFDGKLTSSKWAKIAKCSKDTAIRDINDLIEKNILQKEAAGGRSTNYELVKMNQSVLKVLKNEHVKQKKINYKLQAMMKNFSVLLLIFAMECTSPEVSEPGLMKEAVPVWAEGRETEMNLTLGFQGVFQADKNNGFTLRITASTLYRVFLNGEFLGYGPARTAHGFFRVDEYDIGELLQPGENTVAVEVAGYNVNTYYTLDQPSFLQAELESDGKIALATGNDPGFKAFELNERLQKVERYSFQRPFTEYYRLDEGFNDWKTSADVSVNPLKLAEQPGGQLIPRNLLMPEFETLQPDEIYAKGTVDFQKPEQYYKDRSLVNISEQFKGYPEPELEVLPSQRMQEMTTQTMTEISEDYTEKPVALAENEFTTFDFGTNLSGFIGSRISCSEPTTIIFHFDEILTDGDVNSKKRMADVNNQVVYELEPGTYNLESFESYTFKYLKAVVTKGSCTIHDVYIREYAYPDNPRATFASSNPKLNAIYAAARQTFRQNAVDIFMDCPSRERAGWLCDSYFMAIMEKGFTGKSDVAHNFYENYALADSFQFLPDGMLPMCYPADHNDGVFIPNWAMWFIVQIEDYASRGGDPELIAKLEPRIAALLDYFEAFENESGLLEKLDSWIFVEWSRANDFVQDANYPTNMLYSAALEKAGKLYQNEPWLNKAGKVKQAILEQSFNGEFFVDNAVRSENGELVVTENTTEVCQYYAFFFKIATPETHPDLWKKLTTEFGPNRDDTKTYPDVFRANAFIGNYLRMDILSKYGLQSQLLNEVQDYFYSMAEITGTLWENMSAHASCNHGFASYLGHVLYRDVLGISNIDYLKKEVTIRFADIGLEECSGSVPVDDGVIELQWKHADNQIHYSLNVPENFSVKVENLTSFELVKND